MKGKTMRTISISMILLFLNSFLLADVTVIRPTENHPTSFAIIIDDETYKRNENEIVAYRDAIENDGLSTYIIISSWKNPEEIKSEIIKIYSKDKPLEGIVLIGDIPIPMIRNAQHMTSAFKMNEAKYPWFRSSVPSDRFYDDFDLKFQYLGQDSVHTLCHYYSLLPDSPQRIEKEIYSGRIIPPVNDETKYELINDFLKKIIKIKSKQNELNDMFVFTGHGYNSESLAAWTGEHLALREQFPHMFAPNSRLNFLNFRMSSEMKEILMTELERDELDLAIFHAHGQDDTQILLGYPCASSISQNVESIQMFLRSKLRSAKRREKNLNETKNYYIDKYGIAEEWFEGSFDDSVRTADSLFAYKLDMYSEDLDRFSPMAKFVIFDECFNGSFHEQNYIAGKYLFGNGNTIVAEANTVNCLQDKWLDKFLGLLNYGVRIGQWHKFNSYLENHILGDPTYRFQNRSDYDITKLILFEQENIDTWKKYLNSEIVPLRSLALHSLSKILGEDFEDQLVEIYKSDFSFNVRMHTLSNLAKINSVAFHEILKESITDPFEMIRRKSVVWMGKIGKDEYIPLLINQIISDPSPRVSFTGKSALGNFNSDMVKESTELFINKLPDYTSKDLLMRNMISSIDRNKEWLFDGLLANAFNDTLKLSKRINAIRTFRNYNFQDALPKLLELAADENQPEELRVSALESLGWFNFYYNNNEIIKFCSSILGQSELSITIKSEILKTMNRIITGSNVPITP